MSSTGLPNEIFSPGKSESRGTMVTVRSAGVKMSNRTVIAYDQGSDHALWFGVPRGIGLHKND